MSPVAEDELPSLQHHSSTPRQAPTAPTPGIAIPPIPRTPEKPLPTLTALLASSTKKRRPRANLAFQEGPSVPRMRQETNEAIPPIATLTISQPPSSSQEVDELISETSIPRFTQNPKAFAPADASFFGPDAPIAAASDELRSSQLPGFSQDPRAFAPLDASGAGGKMGMFSRLPFSSQIMDGELDGNIERISELLERDIDFEGWLHHPEEMNASKD
jgi:hypothetical protein